MGPEVPIATPTLPVVRDQPSAMCVAPSSCRTIRCSIEPSCSIALYSGRIAAPGQPNTVSMPSDFRTSTTACMTGIFGICQDLPAKFSMTLSSAEWSSDP